MKFDAIIIGSGQAGNPLWESLTEKGWTVALVEKDHLGGTCINYGCTPTKTMVASAQVAHYARNAARWGVRTGAVSVNLPEIVARKNVVVQMFRGGKESKAKDQKNLRLYRGQAHFVAPPIRSPLRARCSKPTASSSTREPGQAFPALMAWTRLTI